uniref:Structural maintenance of chromosomes protein 6 n=1 Tax=Strongyloides stercoralis TaxID=6248 RepID=A0A0K0EMM5_STRER
MTSSVKKENILCDKPLIPNFMRLDSVNVADIRAIELKLVDYNNDMATDEYIATGAGIGDLMIYEDRDNLREVLFTTKEKNLYGQKRVVTDDKGQHFVKIESTDAEDKNSGPRLVIHVREYADAFKKGCDVHAYSSKRRLFEVKENKLKKVKLQNELQENAKISKCLDEKESCRRELNFVKENYRRLKEIAVMQESEISKFRERIVELAKHQDQFIEYHRKLEEDNDKLKENCNMA